MKVFLSWSGQPSKVVAEALRSWLPLVIQAVKPYMSEEDIAKGSMWAKHLTDELAQAAFGIICLTRDNLDSRWLNFEAGALSKALATNRVCPLLVDLRKTEVVGPLAQLFMMATLDKEEMRKLIVSVNTECREQGLESSQLHTTFERWWDTFDTPVRKKLAGLPKAVEKPARADAEIQAEILELTRAQHRQMLEGFERLAKLLHQSRAHLGPSLTGFGVVRNPGSSDPRYSGNVQPGIPPELTNPQPTGPQPTGPAAPHSQRDDAPMS